MNRSTLFKAFLFFAVATVFGLFCMPVLYTQAEKEKTDAEIIDEAFSKNASANKLKKEVGLLQKVFGIEKESPDNSKGGKKIADVADDALQLTKSLVVSISETLQKVAPNVWRIMIKQQYVKAAYRTIIPWGICLIFFIYFRTVQKRWVIKTGASQDERSCRLAFATIVPVVGCLGSGIAGVLCVASAFTLVVNPEFYAIKDLLLIILGSSS